MIKFRSYQQSRCHSTALSINDPFQKRDSDIEVCTLTLIGGQKQDKNHGRHLGFGAEELLYSHQIWLSPLSTGSET